MLEVLSHGGHVGSHFGKKSCTIYSFESKVLCIQFGVEGPMSHFVDHVGDNFGKKRCTYYSFVTKLVCTKFGAERPTSNFSQGRKLENLELL